MIDFTETEAMRAGAVVLLELVEGKGMSLMRSCVGFRLIVARLRVTPSVVSLLPTLAAGEVY